MQSRNMLTNTKTENSDLILYHTEGCHLCEIAQSLVEQLALSYQHIDICDDEVLAERYGISIPVLVMGDKELFWPFDVPQLTDFIRSVV
ncbi:glutaredoxin family protein [Shewanella electrodiphila]|uniref:Glutaredoxin family protein n=1 Tax=Shewanella electrodiphila TaxID=934143 RepID=A0ABT0KQS8_9GAMM|nr:glutaredoxin family protein [Shewanella electrodiphila]MCL1046198.1 glutaredoxin family protein [Shewanella electrodiphila]